MQSEDKYEQIADAFIYSDVFEPLNLLADGHTTRRQLHVSSSASNSALILRALVPLEVQHATDDA